MSLPPPPLTLYAKRLQTVFNKIIERSVFAHRRRLMMRCSDAIGIDDKEFLSVTITRCHKRTKKIPLSINFCGEMGRDGEKKLNFY